MVPALALGAAVAAVALAGRGLPRRSSNAQSQLLTFSFSRSSSARSFLVQRAVQQRVVAVEKRLVVLLE